MKFEPTSHRSKDFFPVGVKNNLIEPLMKFLTAEDILQEMMLAIFRLSWVEEQFRQTSLPVTPEHNTNNGIARDRSEILLQDLSSKDYGKHRLDIKRHPPFPF